MNLNEIIKKIYDAAELLDAEALISESNSLQNVAEQLTPRPSTEKPEDGQVCLVFTKQGTALGLWIEASGWFDFEYFELGLDQINGWLPAPEWKEDE